MSHLVNLQQTLQFGKSFTQKMSQQNTEFTFTEKQGSFLYTGSHSTLHGILILCE